MKLATVAVVATALALAQGPQAFPGGFHLPNGWRITPVGKVVRTEDLILNLTASRDRRVVVAQHGGFNPHGLVVIDAKTEEAIQRIPLKSAWLGLAWSTDGKRLYVSGGNATSRRDPTVAPIYVFDYANGKLSEKPAQWRDSLPGEKTYWSGLAMHPTQPKLFAANRGNDPGRGHITVFDTGTGKPIQKIDTEVSPYDLVFSEDGSRLYVSNWSSSSVSVIDSGSGKTLMTIPTGLNPNDLELGADGRLYVSNGNENTVTVIDTKKGQAIEAINVGPTSRAPAGSTPNGLALDAKNNMLFVANADNNCVAVVNVAEAGESHVLGFIPSGWYPSALLLMPGNKLYVANTKGLEAHSNVDGPTSPLSPRTAVQDLRAGHSARDGQHRRGRRVERADQGVDEAGLRQPSVQG